MSTSWDYIQNLLRTSSPSRDTPPSSGQETPIPAVKAVALSRDTVSDFIDWACRSGSDSRERVREAIVAASQDAGVVAPLLDAYKLSSTVDFSRSIVILGIIGELRNPQVMNWLAGLALQALPEEEPVSHGTLSRRNVEEMLQSKVVEALAYLQTEEAFSLILQVIANHPSVAVRRAGIDAYLYNHGDSEEAKASLQNIVRKEDILSLEQVRRATAGNRNVFNEGLRRFYQNHPEQLAPPPGEPTALPQADVAAQPPLPPDHTSI